VGWHGDEDPSGIHNNEHTQAKWEQLQACLKRVHEGLLTALDQFLDFQLLESDRGFLNHCATSYKTLRPYLKGYHLTLDSWRANRKEDGWRMSSKEWDHFLESISDDEEREAVRCLGDASHPARVQAAPRLKGDVKAMMKLTSAENPTEASVRARRVYQVIYGFGDASGKGFGDSFLSEDGISIHIGVWTYDESKKSSNYREFRNQLDALRREGEAGRLKGAFVLFLTDNVTFEASCFKNRRASPQLLDMVLEWNQLQMDFGFVGMVVWVAGTQMIAERGDGLSRGATNEGIMSGKSMLWYIPLHLNVHQRHIPFWDWICTWLPKDAVPLKPEDWFVRGHDVCGGEVGPDKHWRPIVKSGTMIWFPQPAIADVALEALRKARIK
jgi:hypothetical protein